MLFFFFKSLRTNFLHPPASHTFSLVVEVCERSVYSSVTQIWPSHRTTPVTCFFHIYIHTPNQLTRDHNTKDPFISSDPKDHSLRLLLASLVSHIPGHISHSGPEGPWKYSHVPPSHTKCLPGILPFNPQPLTTIIFSRLLLSLSLPFSPPFSLPLLFPE